ncbi:hypothetical protein [Streptomyces chrestomyceticus]|uniref:hypothetical protein n=1 Tax=Streptomyces chrestomyceticus TaxID=68185 RepID=UPI0033F1CBEE
MPHTTPPAPGDSSAPATLERLLSAVPADVRAVFSARTLRPLLPEHDRTGTLLHTLEVFLRHDASWSRTAAPGAPRERRDGNRRPARNRPDQRCSRYTYFPPAPAFRSLS